MGTLALAAGPRPTLDQLTGRDTRIPDATTADRGFVHLVYDAPIRAGVRVCELLVDAVAADEQDLVKKTIEKAKALVAADPLERYERPFGSRDDPKSGRIRGLSDRLKKKVTSEEALLIAEALRDRPEIMEPALHRVRQIHTDETLATELVEAVIGFRDPRSAALITAYKGTDAHAANWVGARIRGEWAARVRRAPIGRAWLMPVLIDMGERVWLPKLPRELDFAVSDQFRDELQRLQVEPLTPEQEQVAIALAFDGELDRCEIPAAARRLA